MKNLLKSKGLKVTQGRLEILHILNNSVPLSAFEIIKKVDNKKISNSSVYRILADFESKGIVKKTIYQNQIAYYELNVNNHRHFIICDRCGKIEELPFCPVTNLNHFEKDIEDGTKYLVKSHIIQFHGICPKCQKK